MLQSFLSNPWGVIDLAGATTPQRKVTSSAASPSSSKSAAPPAPTSLAARLQPYVVNGFVLYNPGGPFQEYLLRVEDALLLHLLKASDSRPETLQQYAIAFIKAAALAEDAYIKTKGQGAEDVLMTASPLLTQLRSVNHSVYAAQSPVASLRLAVRALSALRPADLFEHIDTTLMRIAQQQSLAGQEPVRPLGRQALRNHAKSLATLEKLALCYMPLQDDPLGGVLHLNRLQLPADAAPTSSSSSSSRAWGLDLQHSGSQQIHGLFVPHPLHSVERPYLCSSQGYAITRERRIISAPPEDGSGPGESDEPMEALFVWYIFNPSLSTVYYSCSTVEGSPLPPLLGWQQSGLGKLPPPLLRVVDSPPPVDLSGGAGAGPVRGSIGGGTHTQGERPFDQTSFSRVPSRGRGGRTASARRQHRDSRAASLDGIATPDGSLSDSERTSSGHGSGSDNHSGSEEDDVKDAIVSSADADDDESEEEEEEDEDSVGDDSVEMATMGLLERVFVARKVRSTASRHLETIGEAPSSTPPAVVTALKEVTRSSAVLLAPAVLGLGGETWTLGEGAAEGIAARVLQGDEHVSKLLLGCWEAEDALRERLIKLEAKRVWLSAAEAESLIEGFEGEGKAEIGEPDIGGEGGAEQQAAFFSQWSLDTAVARCKLAATERAEHERELQEQQEKIQRASAASVGAALTIEGISPQTSAARFSSVPASPLRPSLLGTAPTTPTRSANALESSSSDSPVPHDRDRRGLGELLEMTQPSTGSGTSRGGSGGDSNSSQNGMSGRVSVLGVEMWPPSRKNRSSSGVEPANSPYPEKLCYVIRLTLSDIANEQPRAEDKIREQHNNAASSSSSNQQEQQPKSDEPTLPAAASASASASADSDASVTEQDSGDAQSDDDSDIGMGLEGEAIEIEDSQPTPALASLSQLGEPGGKSRYREKGDLFFDQEGGNEGAGSTEARQGESSYAGFARNLVRRLASRIGTDSRRVFTVRRDLPTLCTFHAELSLLLGSADGAVQPPPFPDPFTIGTAEEEVLRVLLQDSLTRKLRLGQPFLYTSAFRAARGGGGASGSEYGLSVPQRIQAGLDASAAQIQAYFEAVLALLESVEDEHSECGPELSTESEREAGSGTDHQPEKAFSPSSSSGSLSLLLQTASTPTIATATTENGGPPSPRATHQAGSAAMAKSVGSVSRRLGRLVGKFLQSADLEDLMDLRVKRDGASSPGSVSGLGMGERSSSGRAQPASGAREDEVERRMRVREEERVFSPKRKGKDGPAAPSGIEWQGRAGTLHVGERQIRVVRPSWHAFAASGLLLRVTVNDEQGGRLSLKNEEEMVRGQRSKCLGCGEPLLSGFFGLERNYQPCRYHGGLFCKRWCHLDSHRVVPHRLLNYWDAVPHRVCAAAANFLDEVWNSPVLHLSAINPLLYEGLPTLRQSRTLRARIAEQLDCLTEREPEAAEAAVECVLQTMGARRVYLCVSEELYCMSDLLQVQSGDLLPALTKLTELLQGLGRKRRLIGW